MGRPRILLVPTLCDLEWQIAPTLASWAEVATFDAPGVGDESEVEQPGPRAIIERGLAELDDRGWDRCVIAGDEFGLYHATHIAAARPAAVQGLVLGHACLSLSETGDRAPVNGEVWGALTRLRDVDYRTYARHLTQITRDAYDDEFTDRYIERVPHPVLVDYDKALAERSEETLEPLIASLDVPLLLAKHKDCLLFTDEGWQDTVAAFPDAVTVETVEKPSCSPVFAEALRTFCARI